MIKSFNQFLFESKSGIKIAPNDKIIMSGEETIVPRDVLPDLRNKISFKPRGLWYAFGSEWIDWVKGNMPEWERKHIHKIEIDYTNVLRLGVDMSWDDFENEFGVSRWREGVITDIDWFKVFKKWYGIEVKDPGGELGSWERTWDVSSGCIWRAKAIKKITRLQ